jgi:hypothetical protein
MKEPTMTLRSNRSGFALPMAILLIGFMTAGVLAAFARTGAEVQIVDNQSADTRAYANAERGLGQFLAGGKPPTVDPFTVNYTYPDGGATVTVTRMRPRAFPKDTAVWLVQSTGRVVAQSGRPLGERTVAQLGQEVIGQMQVLSSWTSLNTLNKSGDAGSISGIDPCTGTSVAGVATPTGGLTGKTDLIVGDPQHLQMGNTLDSIKDHVKIDWLAITDTAAPAIDPDVMVCTPGTYGYTDASWGGHSCGSWPSSFANWPVILVNGSLTPNLPSNGQGTLIVTGDLDIGGNQYWDGIILVGGRIHDKGNGGITGAVISGLNVLKGETVGMSIVDEASGTKDYQYDSCTVANAMANMSRLEPLDNAWIDNWKTW